MEHIVFGRWGSSDEHAARSIYWLEKSPTNAVCSRFLQGQLMLVHSYNHVAFLWHSFPQITTQGFGAAQVSSTSGSRHME